MQERLYHIALGRARAGDRRPQRHPGFDDRGDRIGRISRPPYDVEALEPTAQGGVPESGLNETLTSPTDAASRIKGLVMPLHLNIRPGERLFINGAVIQNVKSRTIDFTIENAARVLRESECLTADDACTLAGRVTLALQKLHLSEDRLAQFSELTALFPDVIRQLPGARPVVRQIRKALAIGNTYGALKMGRDLYDIERRI